MFSFRSDLDCGKEFSGDPDTNFPGTIAIIGSFYLKLYTTENQQMRFQGLLLIQQNLGFLIRDTDDRCIRKPL